MQKERKLKQCLKVPLEKLLALPVILSHPKTEAGYILGIKKARK